MPAGLRDPILVSGTDGVGTKLKIAFATGRHDTIGIDLVAMCVNDIVTCGAQPLFFLDYFATEKLDVDVGEAVISGIAQGCKLAGCALLGGETAELPGMYHPGEYDLAGFAVGVVERSKILDGKRTQRGDAVVAIASSGLHSNGYSLARRVLIDSMKLDLYCPFPGEARSVAEVLLTPTKVFARLCATMVQELGDRLRGISHITGGGLSENLPRVLPQQFGARLDLSSYRRPNLFDVIAKGGPVTEAEMLRTFNMGVGLTVIVEASSAQELIQVAEREGEQAWVLGEVIETSGPDRVVIA